MLLLFLACNTPGSETPAEPPTPPEQQELVYSRIQSPQIGDGFGSAVVIGSSVFVGAPNTPNGRVYRISPENDAALFFEESTPGAAGSALAFHPDGRLLIGAPLFDDGAGRVYANTEVLQDGGRVLGGRIIARGEDLFVTESFGLWENGAYQALEHRIFSVEKWGETTVLGHAFGETAIVVGDQAISRMTAHDELGYALCAANFDDDPEDELAIGAPGAGKVYILNPEDSLDKAMVIDVGEGRFGHSLACTDGLLLVGGPSLGEELRGGAWCFQGKMDTWSTQAPTYQGQAWEQLGTAVALQQNTMVIGAPGNANTRGSAHLITW